MPWRLQDLQEAESGNGNGDADMLFFVCNGTDPLSFKSNINQMLETALDSQYGEDDAQRIQTHGGANIHPEAECANAPFSDQEGAQGV